MNSLLALSYNNYYNRIFKREDLLANYLKDRDFQLIDNINFNPNEETETEQIINWDNKSFFPNYFIVLNDNQEIVSRWFVTKSERTRGKQYKLSLRRDLLADFYEGISTSDIFVEKANPLKNDEASIFNNEGMVLNQIKKEEILLKDQTNVSWIVGYIAKNHSLSGTITIDAKSDLDVIDIDTTFANWKFNVASLNKPSLFSYNIRFQSKVGLLLSYNIYSTINKNKFSSLDSAGAWSSLVADYGMANPTVDKSRFSNWVAQQLFEYYKDNNLFSSLESAAASKFNGIDDTEYNELLQYNGKYIKDINGEIRFFNIVSKIQRTTTSIIDPEVISGVDVTLRNLLKTPIDAFNWFTDKRLDGNSFSLSTSYEQINLNLSSPIVDEQTTLTWTSGPLSTDDAQFNMIAIPYGSLSVIDATTTPAVTSFTTSKELAINTAIAIAKSLGTNLYDLQIVPYFPMQEMIYKFRTNTIYFKDNKQVSIITNSSNSRVGIVIHCTKSNFTFDINEEITVNKDDLSLKLSNECDIYRLCSPNYSGIFEFSVAKNNGVNSFNVDCTYKPYSPYIHLNPDFKGLYGSDFNDARGLICGGDFSFGIVSDQWQQYEINNKNYRDIFDRQIQSMDINNSITRQEAAFGAFAGGLTGGSTAAIGGALAGSKMGGPYGAAAGAIVGAVGGGTLSTLGGVIDLQNLEKRITEARSFAIDMYNFNLGNIKALPYSLTKVSSLTLNNKLFPFIEKYSCTDEEKEALKNKIKFNGATIMKIGKFSDYSNEANDDNMTRFFQGQLIRINDETLSQESPNVISEINIELSKGVYL